jgi:beta-galactosidase
MKMLAAFLCLALPASAGTATPFNDGWRFARFGPMPDGSTLPEPGGPHLPVAASSEEPGHPPGHALDGSSITRWCASDGRPGQTLTIDLGRPVALRSVTLQWEKPGGLDLALATSTDGKSWQSLPAIPRAAADSALQEVAIPDTVTEARHLRFTITGTDPGRWASIAEITFRDAAGQAVTPQAPTDLAAQSPADPAFNDSSWRTLTLPHDWGIEGPFRLELDGATGKLPWAGIGWYRKSFSLPAEAKDKRYYLEVDGAMSDSTLFLNGKEVGRWPYGYSSFRIELTPAIKPGEQNLLAIRLDNKPASSRWYPGGGIYRDVRLVEAPGKLQNILHNGLRVTTPEISAEKATVKLSLGLEDGDCPANSEVSFEVLSPEGKVLASTSGQSCAATLELPQPVLWTLEKPHLYTVRATFSRKDQGSESITAPLGIRSIRFDENEGFFLNGVRTSFKGVCLHHDLGPLGSAWHPEAAERQLRIMKEMGCNAIRTSHNPPAPGMVDLCDRMGILLQVEAFDCWDKPKSPNDYARHFKDWHERDLRLMVRNFRNHPSVVMWSIGNEINGGYQNSPDGWKTADALRTIVKSEDDTRPVSMGNNDTRAAEHLWKGLDIIGFNYKPDLYAKFRERKTGVPVYGSETASTISSRGEYFFPVSWDKSKGEGDFQMSSYDLSAPPWAQRPDIEFEAQDKTQPWNPGEFVWTGIDYIGEPTPYNEDQTNLLNIQDPKERERLQKQLEEVGRVTPPSRSSYFGIADLCGFPKDRYYLYQARWRPELPLAHILPHWNWPGREGEITPVHVYTSGDEAELFLNGRSLGRKKKEPFHYRIVWEDVKYEPGELRVVSYKDGKKWAEAGRSTTGPAAKLLVEAEPPIGKGELVYLTLTVADAKGRLVPRSKQEIRFEVSGPAEILAAGNGDATSHITMHRAKAMPAYNGLCQVILRRTGPGEIGFKATAEGLAGAGWSSK